MEVIDVSWAGEPGSLGGLVNVENFGPVLDPYKVRNCGDPSGLSTKVGDRNFNYVLTFADCSGQRAILKDWWRRQRRRLVTNQQREGRVQKNVM